MIYHIDMIALTVISGPYSASSDYAKKVTRCGTPDVLFHGNGYCDLADGTRLVQAVYPAKTETQKYDGVTVFSDRVEHVVVDKTVEEINAKRVAEIDAELSALDVKVPRGLEDMVAATGVFSSLPAYTQGIITTKQTLREERARLV